MAEVHSQDYLAGVYYARELSSAIARFCTADTLNNIKHALETGLITFDTSPDREPVGDSIAQIARLVLQDFDTTEHRFTSDPQEDGQNVLTYIQEALFSKESLSNSFVHTVYLSNGPAAKLAHDVCIAALLDSLSVQNCISLFSFGLSSGCNAILEPAYKMTMQQFSQAYVEDYDGLSALPEETLKAFLTSDDLVVDTELDVFKAFAAWVEYDLPARISKFAPRMASVVRFSQLTIADMTFMVDEHPLVSLDNEAVQIVTYAILQHYMNSNFDDGPGRLSINRPRRCQNNNHPNHTTSDTAINTSLHYPSVFVQSLKGALSRNNALVDVEQSMMNDENYNVANTVKPSLLKSANGPLANSIAGIALEMYISPTKATAKENTQSGDIGQTTRRALAI